MPRLRGHSEGAGCRHTALMAKTGDVVFLEASERGYVAFRKRVCGLQIEVPYLDLTHTFPQTKQFIRASYLAIRPMNQLYMH